MTSVLRPVEFTPAGQSELQLEGRLHLPTGRGPFPVAVLAHPHPLWGGTMDTPVLVYIAQALVDQGWIVLRFNFRGVGRSQGNYDEGRGETDDLIGALDWLTSQDWADTARLAVVGYSFGAWVGGMAAACDNRVHSFVAVALPMSEPYRVDLSRFAHLKCFITGARDTISPPELLREYVGGMPEPKTLIVIPDTDHFLLGSERLVADHVAGVLMSYVL